MSNSKKSYDCYKDKIEDLFYSKTDEKEIISAILINRFKESTFNNFLDIGPGIGIITKIFYKKSDRTTLIELLPEYKNILEQQFPKSNIIIDSILNTDLEDKFDLILVNQCLYYFKEKQWLPLIEYLLNSLTNNGQLLIILNDHHKNDLDKIFKEFLPKLSDYSNFSYLPLISFKEQLSQIAKVDSVNYNYSVNYSSKEELANSIGRMFLEIENEEIIKNNWNSFMSFAEVFKKDSKYVVGVDAEIITLTKK